MDYYKIIYIYLIGVVVIIGNQLIDLLNYLIGVPNWHDIIVTLPKEDIIAILSSLSLVSIIILFLIYPIIIGLLAYLVTKIFVT